MWTSEFSEISYCLSCLLIKPKHTSGLSGLGIYCEKWEVHFREVEVPKWTFILSKLLQLLGNSSSSIQRTMEILFLPTGLPCFGYFLSLLFPDPS